MTADNLRTKNIYVFVGCLILATMFGASAMELTRPFWLDEVASLEISKDPNMWAAMRYEVHPPVYPLLVRFALAFLPENEFYLHLVSLFFTLLTVIFLVKISVSRLKILPLPAMLFLSCPM